MTSKCRDPDDVFVGGGGEHGFSVQGVLPVLAQGEGGSCCCALCLSLGFGAWSSERNVSDEIKRWQG